MKTIHRIGKKAVSAFVLVVFVNLQVVPHGWADSVPLAQEIQNQVPTAPVDSSVPSESGQPVPETSIDFLKTGGSALSVPEPIELPEVPRDIPPINMPDPESRFEHPTQVPVEPIDPKLVNPDWMKEPEVVPVTIEEIPQPELELTPAPEPLEPETRVHGNAVISFFGFFRPIFGRMIATIQAMRSLVDRFNLSKEEKDEVLKDIKVVSVEKKTWSNGCVGWHTGPCTMALVTGYQVVLELYGNTYEFHAGRLDPAKVAAISAINHLMEHGTPKVPWSDHIVYPKLSQIKIGGIMILVKYQNGFVSESSYDIDLRVEWNKKRSVTWRYTVDAKTNEVVRRKLYGIRQLTEHIAMLFLIDYDHGERFKPKRPRAWRKPARHADRFHRDVISHGRKLELKEPIHGFGLAASYQEKTETVNR